MELSQIRYFIEAAEKLHFASAAESLGITQPSLSRGIKMLENNLGIQLFDRSNKRKIMLTESGKEFLRNAKAAMNQLNMAERNAKSAACGRLGHVSIGALASALERNDILNAFSTIQRKYPEISLEIIDDHSSGLAHRILNRTADLIITRYDYLLFENQDLICEKIFEDELLLVLPKKHIFAKGKNISVKKLKDEKMILVPERTSPAYRECIDSICKISGGFQPNIAEVCSNFYTAQHLVKAGFGITIIPASHKNLFPDSLIYRKFADVIPKSPVYLIYWNDCVSRCTKVILKELHNIFA